MVCLAKKNRRIVSLPKVSSKTPRLEIRGFDWTSTACTIFDYHNLSLCNYVCNWAPPGELMANWWSIFMCFHGSMIDRNRWRRYNTVFTNRAAIFNQFKPSHMDHSVQKQQRTVENVTWQYWHFGGRKPHSQLWRGIRGTNRDFINGKLLWKKNRKIPCSNGKKWKKPQDILTHKYLNTNFTLFQRSVILDHWVLLSFFCPFKTSSYFSASVSSKQEIQNAKKGDENSQNKYCHVEVGGLLSVRSSTWQDTICLY